MTGMILPFRYKKQQGPTREQIFFETQMRDELVAGFLELRDVWLPQMRQQDRRALFVIDYWLMHGGLNESRRVLESNLAVVSRLLARVRPPRRGWLLDRFLRWLNKD